IPPTPAEVLAGLGEVVVRGDKTRAWLMAKAQAVALVDHRVVRRRGDVGRPRLEVSSSEKNSAHGQKSGRMRNRMVSNGVWIEPSAKVTSSSASNSPASS